MDFVKAFGIEEDAYDIESTFVNTGHKSLLDAVAYANKFLVDKKDFSHHYVSSKQYLEQKEREYTGYAYEDLLAEIDREKKEIDSFELHYRKYKDDYSDLEKLSILFMEDSSVFIKFMAKKAEVSRGFNPKTDALVNSKYDYLIGKDIELFGKSYFVYGTIGGYISFPGSSIPLFDQSQYFIDNSQFETHFRTLDKHYRDYDGGRLTGMSLFYKNPRIVDQKRQVLQNKFQDKNPNGTFKRFVTSKTQSRIDEELARVDNVRRSTRALSLSIVIVSGISMMALLSISVFIFKRNYAANRFKKNVSKRDLISPSIISGLFILVSLLTFLTKNVAYMLTVYDLAGYMNFKPLEYELANRISDVTTTVTLCLSVVIAIYLYIRNIDFRRKKEENHGL